MALNFQRDFISPVGSMASPLGVMRPGSVGACPAPGLLLLRMMTAARGAGPIAVSPAAFLPRHLDGTPLYFYHYLVGGTLRWQVAARIVLKLRTGRREGVQSSFQEVAQ